MKKFIVVESGKEIKLGDNLIVAFKTNTSYGSIEVKKSILITVSTLRKLIKEGVVKAVDSNGDDENVAIWNTALLNIAKKTGWSAEKLDYILTTIDSVNPWAATQIVLKEIAVILDKKYEDHINESEKIYAISPQDGRIHELNKKSIKNYKAFPAFRNIEDAKVACSLVKENLKSLFND